MRIALVAVSALAVSALTGCGGAPAPAESAWQVHLTASDPTCGKPDSTIKLGAVTDTTIPMVVDDGTDGLRINCSVAGSGSGPYSVNASTTQGANVLQILINSISTSATQDSPALGSVIYASSSTITTYQSPGATCNFYFQNKKETVDPGQIWVAFDCPAIQDNSVNPPSVCELPASPPSNPSVSSIAVFEGCSTIAE